MKKNQENSTAVAIIDGVSYTLNVFDNGGVKYSTTAELPNGTHSLTSFIYNEVEYVTEPMSIIADNAKVKQLSLIDGDSPANRSLGYEDLAFGYVFMEFAEEEPPVTETIPFHCILGVTAEDLPNYIGSDYESQPNGLQSLMKALYRVQYFHNGIHIATYGLFSYNDGAPTITYINNPDSEDTNVFKIQHRRWLDEVGAIVGVVGEAFSFTVANGNFVTGSNGIVNIDIVPDSTWDGSADYTLYYT